MVSGVRIAVSGANGFVARNLRRLLARRGMPVLCISRRDLALHGNESQVTTADYDKKDIMPELADCTALVHLVGIGRQSYSSDYASTNTALTRRLVRCARQSSVRKIVFLSGLGVSSRPSTDYFISKYRAERDVITSGLDYTIFRPSYILGRDDHLTASLRRQIRRGAIVVPGSGRFAMQPIYVGDACEIILQSILHPRYSNRTVDLVGPQNITYKTLVSKLKFKTTERRGLERAYREAISSTRGAFGVDDLNILVGGFTGDFKKLQRLSGLDFVPYTDVLEASGLS